ncbi:MAG: DUF1465 family protein [Alphaproteobacteria bacterium]|nr:DUF1465 family protein [Rhodospirillales bacterium]MCW9044764.1 DUF1465 family protein [Alphaproteobacteria bacterium]
MNSLFSDLLLQSRALSDEMRYFLENSPWLRSKDRSFDQRLEVFNMLMFLCDSLTALQSWGAAQEAVLQGLLMPEEAAAESSLLAETEEHLQEFTAKASEYPEELQELLERFGNLFFGSEQLDSLILAKAA